MCWGRILHLKRGGSVGRGGDDVGEGVKSFVVGKKKVIEGGSGGKKGLISTLW